MGRVTASAFFSVSGWLGQVDALALLLLEVQREGELVVLVPGHLVLAHPERGDLDRVLGNAIDGF